MKFLLDQNVPHNFNKMLRDSGHEPITLKMLGKTQAKNGEVGAIAMELDAVIITFDKHFLSLKRTIQQNVRIIHVNVHPLDPGEACGLLHASLPSCLGKLKTPGVIILSRDGVVHRHP